MLRKLAAGNLCLTDSTGVPAAQTPAAPPLARRFGQFSPSVHPIEHLASRAKRMARRGNRMPQALSPRWHAERIMDDYLRIDDLSAADLRTILSTDLDQLSDDEVLAIKDFVMRVGGVRNARMAVEMLHRLEDAA
ncbi:MAG TPA: hypothetical protein VMF30_05320 [Pirellulales bacterium]|nr:hypothetical protein [Pirellulales bacterium]